MLIDGINCLQEFNQSQMEQISQKLGMSPDHVTMDASNAIKVDQINEHSFYEQLRKHDDSQAAI